MRRNEMAEGYEQQTDMKLVTWAMKFRDGLDKIGFGRTGKKNTQEKYYFSVAGEKGH